MGTVNTKQHTATMYALYGFYVFQITIDRVHCLVLLMLLCFCVSDLLRIDHGSVTRTG